MAHPQTCDGQDEAGSHIRDSNRQIFEEVTTKMGTNPFQAKSFGKDHTNPNLLQGWHAIHLEAVFKIILSAAFSDAVFLHCLLDPVITAFVHTLPPGRKDPFWMQPGENQHGKLLWKACQFVITVATYWKYYLEHPYMVVGVPHVYFGPNIRVTDLPDIVAFLVEYQCLPEVEQPEEDDSFIMDFSVAPGDVTAICGVAPTEESLLVDAPAQLEVNDIRDDPFEELEIMVAEDNLEVLDAVGSQEESSCRSNRSHAPPTCCVCLTKPSFGLQRHACYTHLPWFVQYLLTCWVCQRNFAQPSKLRKHMEKEGHQGLFNEVHKMEWVYLMNQLLQYIAISLQLPRTSALLSFVSQDATLWAGLDKKLDADDLQMLSHFEDVNGTFTNTCYTYNPPNSIASLTHWKVLLNLVSPLPWIQQEVIKTINTGCFQTGEPISEEGEEDEVIGSDSHFHPDQLVKRTRKSIAEVMAEGKVRLDPIVSCLAFPHTWYQMQ